MRTVSRKVELFLRAAKAPNTVRAYASDIRHFVNWGGRVPASPNTVAEYLAELASTHRYSSIARRRAALVAAHREKGLSNPCAAEVVRSVMKGLRRRIAKPPRQMRPLLWTQIEKMVEGNLKTLEDLQARVILLVGFAGALRRSELISLQVHDLGWRVNDLVIRVVRSKGDQEGVGQEVTVVNARRSCIGKALGTWLRVAGIREGALFRRIQHGSVTDMPLAASAITGMLKKRMKIAGIDSTDYGSHSLRAGFVTSAALAGIPLWEIKRYTRHSRDTLVETYIRGNQAPCSKRVFPWALPSTRVLSQR